MKLPTAYKGIGWTALAGSLLMAAVILNLNNSFYHDDAYITLRYASNLLQGHGVVWNPGEYVQGYTSVLHLMLISALGYLGIDLVTATKLIGLAALLGLLASLLVYGIDRLGDGPLWSMPALLTVSSAPLLIWAIGGLEGTLYALLVSLGCLIHVATPDETRQQRRVALSGLFLGMAFLTRPDGAIFVAITGAWLLYDVIGKRQPFGTLLIYAGAVTLVVFPYQLWQLLYYGDIIPNTFYAKATGISSNRLEPGFNYLFSYALEPPFLPLLALGGVVYALVTRTFSRAHAYLALLVFVYLSYVVTVGGDHMQAFRFMLPVIPLMSFLAALALQPFFSARSDLIVAGSLLILVAVVGTQGVKPALSPIREDPASFVGTMVGKYIARSWPEQSLVALNTAGSTPYYATRNRYIDMLGLNDAHIAHRDVGEPLLAWQTVPGHAKGDGDYVLSREPDFIIVGPAQGIDISRPWFLSDFEMGSDERFARHYRKREVLLDLDGRISERSFMRFIFYERNDGMSSD